MRDVVALFFVLATVLAVVGACDKSDSDEPSAADRQQAQEIYTQRCTTCHGATGLGDGAASAGLNPQPRNYSDSSWQAEVTDEHIEQIIVQGGAAVGLSAAMPNNPDLRDKPGVVTALREIIRGFGSSE